MKFGTHDIDLIKEKFVIKKTIEKKVAPVIRVRTYN